MCQQQGLHSPVKRHTRQGCLRPPFSVPCTYPNNCGVPITGTVSDGLCIACCGVPSGESLKPHLGHILSAVSSCIDSHEKQVVVAGLKVVEPSLHFMTKEHVSNKRRERRTWGLLVVQLS